MNILVVVTGGTIGSKVTGDWIAPDETQPFRVIENYVAKHPDTDVHFRTCTPFITLSEQISHDHLNTLIDCIHENMSEDIGGVIITHGTDTLPYTAAGLGFVFAKSKLPIVLVSSNYPLDDKRANGNFNFAAAVSFIRSRSGRGVFVSNRNADNVTRLHRATRLLKHRETDDAVYSIANKMYAICEDDVIIRNTAYRPADRVVGFPDARFSESSDVLTVQCKPGESYAYDLEYVKSVLIQPYHSGTVNTESEAFRRFCRRAAERNIPIFLVDVKEGAQYESAKAFDELGINVLPLCAYIPIYMKLWLATSLGEDPKTFALTPLAEEFIV